MKRKIPHWLFGLLSALIITNVVAFSEVNDLYAGTVPVSSRDQAQWNKAVVQAWLQVLAKVSGNPNVASVDTIQAQANQAAQYVRSYSYQELPTNQLELMVRFDSSEVNTILHTNNQPVWSDKRPLTLVWLAYPATDGTLRVLSAADQTALLAAFQNDAFAVGVPVVFPMLDLTDLDHISAQQVASLDAVALDNASKRYQADDVLAGRLWQNYQGLWQANWMLMQGNQFQEWQTSGNSADANIQQVMSNLIKTFASQYADAEAGAGKETLVLRIEHVNGLNDYANVVQYLRNLSPVTRVSVSEVDGQTLVLSVDVLGGEKALNAALAIDNKLYPDVMAGDNSANALTYSWGIKPETNTDSNEVPSWQYN